MSPTRERVTRAATTVALVTLPLALAACGGESAVDQPAPEAERPVAEHDEGRLAARPGRAAVDGSRPAPGMQVLGGVRGNGFLYVPKSYRPQRPAPLVVALHGAGGDASAAVSRLVPLADRAGAIVVGPKSRGNTWDYVFGGYGPDVASIDRTLERIFDTYSVDPSRVGVQGFSDGATYALALGITNGDLFQHVVAFSPGFMDTDHPHGSPGFFVTHGVDDPILPIDQTSRELVPELRELGYPVTYREFDGKHEVPDDLVPEALSWLGEKPRTMARADVVQQPGG